MSTQIACVPVTTDAQVGHSWGKATAVAIASVEEGAITDWRVEDVHWDASFDRETPGSHHARIARFLLDHEVTTVVADHMGEPMENMLAKLGMRVRLGAGGDARAAVTGA